MNDQLPAAEPQAAKSPPERGILGYLAIALALVVAIGAGAYLFVSGGEDDELPKISPAIGTPQPNTGPIDPNRPKEGEMAPDFALPDARDPSKLVKLSDFRGTPVVVNFYYSTCGPCKNEIPTFVKAEQSLGPQVVFLGVDWLEDEEKAVSILEKYGAAYPAVLDRSGSVAEHYRVQGFPATFFVDSEGVLQALRTGEVHEDMLAGFLQKIGVTYAP